MSDTESIRYNMLLCRRFDEEIIARYPDQLMRCPVHLGIGQEAIAVGVCHHLRKEDSVFSTHRNHSHFIAKGGDIEKFALEIYGKVGGCNGGRGGSMHALDTSVNFFSSPIVASAIPLAVGKALANKLEGNGNVVVCFFGDAAIEEGVFHESLNFASLMKLPIIFVCENNQYSVDTRIEKRQPKGRRWIDIANAHYMHFAEFSGNEDVLKIADSFKEITDEARCDGPCFVVFDTQRSHIHCGVDREFELEIDPLDRCGHLYEVTISTRIKKAFDAAEAAPLPTPDMAKEYVYA